MKNEEIINAIISNEFNAETLTKKSKPIQLIDSKIIELAEDLKIAIKLTNADGISALQIGVHKRIIAFKNISGDIEVLVNPEITDTEGKQTEKEGCLSFPHIFGSVERPREVVVKALNLQSEEIIVKGKNELARVLVHEIEHLDGDLFINKVKGTIEDPYDLKRKIYDVLQKRIQNDSEQER